MSSALKYKKIKILIIFHAKQIFANFSQTDIYIRALLVKTIRTEQKKSKALMSHLSRQTQQ